ncbi:MAG: hypothetical protein JNN00_09495 [Chitinophagaceae bacterium]|nr:hypothetical protein [Chitinophagaceae bacterium]
MNIVYAQKVDTVACRIVEENLKIVERFLSGVSDSSEKRLKSFKFLMDLTGITSESDIDTFGQIFPTERDYILWKRWYLRNKFNLFWDDKNKVLLLHKSVQIE